MKIHASFLTLVVVVGIGAIAYLYTPASDAPAPPPVAATEPALKEAADTVLNGDFAPHRALYDLHLARTTANSRINNVTGQMMFKWDDACEGWTIEQRLDMNYLYEGGTEAPAAPSGQNSKTSLASWEAKDGSQFRFNVRRETNGEVTEVFRGSVMKANAGNMTAQYTAPAAHNIELQGATLFPSVHTLELLRAAKSGQHVFSREVFDGADAEGRNYISAFIGNPQMVVAPAGVNSAAWRQGRAWPIRMAFFSPQNKTGTPDYEMSMLLLENGVAAALTIDYGDFSVEATLHDVEPLSPTCS